MRLSGWDSTITGKANMWIDEQPRRDKAGKRWHFRIWHDVWTEDRMLMAERLFFWDDSKTFTGVVLFPPGREVHFSRMKTLIEKLVADPALRGRYRRDLRFPLDRFYAEYGAFFEESSN